MVLYKPILPCQHHHSPTHDRHSHTQAACAAFQQRTRRVLSQSPQAYGSHALPKFQQRIRMVLSQSPRPMARTPCLNQCCNTPQLAARTAPIQSVTPASHTTPVLISAAFRLCHSSKRHARVAVLLNDNAESLLYPGMAAARIGDNTVQPCKIIGHSHFHAASTRMPLLGCSCWPQHPFSQSASSTLSSRAGFSCHTSSTTYSLSGATPSRSCHNTHAVDQHHRAFKLCWLLVTHELYCIRTQ